MLYAGVSRRNINPPTGVDLTGYAGRMSGCVGIHDDLYTKALVLSDGNMTSAVVTLDLLGLDSSSVRELREQINKLAGIPPTNILVAASHTHSGPATQLLRACGTCDQEYVMSMLGKAVDAVCEAREFMQPVIFRVGRALTDLAVNRRYPMVTNSLPPKMEKAVIDPEVLVWNFMLNNGDVLATIFNYACHAVVMDRDNLMVSADWPGAAAREIEGRLGGQAMFIQGCCGNLNPRWRGTFEDVERSGKLVADSVLQAISQMVSAKDTKLDVDREVLNLPLDVPSSEELNDYLMEIQKRLDEVSTSGADKEWLEAMKDWADSALTALNHGQTTTAFEVQRFSVGNNHIIALPGEVFVEYALNLKSEFTGLLVGGYANGNIGYVPTAAAFSEGGYEVETAYKLYANFKLTPDCEKQILDSARRLLTRTI